MCAELPMRHAFRPKEKDDVFEMCEELLDDNEGQFQRLAVKRDKAYASTFCSEELDICEDAIPLAQLRVQMAGDPVGEKDEV